jgi:nucleoid DNA-binding protein
VVSIDLAQTEEYINEVEIVTGDLNELKKRVAALLLCFLNVEEDNKDAIDYTYEQIMQKVKRDKDVEKKGIIERLGNMSVEERRVENDLKNYRIGRWNVGEQKGLYKYDKKTFDREIDEMLAQGEEIEFEDTGDLADIDDIGPLEQGEDAENIYERGAVDLGNLGDNFMDGGYYEEDREYED